MKDVWDITEEDVCEYCQLSGDCCPYHGKNYDVCIRCGGIANASEICLDCFEQDQMRM